MEDFSYFWNSAILSAQLQGRIPVSTSASLYVSKGLKSPTVLAYTASLQLHTCSSSILSSYAYDACTRKLWEEINYNQFYVRIHLPLINLQDNKSIELMLAKTDSLSRILWTRLRPLFVSDPMWLGFALVGVPRGRSCYLDEVLPLIISCSVYISTTFSGLNFTI